jgi:hypothetical protein
VRNSSVKRRPKARCDLFAKCQSFDESKKHELSAAANRWIFVTPARMFLPHLSLSRILPAVMLSSGFSNLPTYNNSLDASGISGLVIDNLSVASLSPAASTQPLYCFSHELSEVLDSGRCLLRFDAVLSVPRFGFRGRRRGRLFSCKDTVPVHDVVYGGLPFHYAPILSTGCCSVSSLWFARRRRKPTEEATHLRVGAVHRSRCDCNRVLCICR